MIRPGRVLAGALLLAFASQASLAAQSVTNAQATPNSAPAAVATTVTATAVVAADPNFIAGSVNLIRYEANQKTSRVLGVMYDDGTHGDAVANDRVFTTRITVSDASPGVFYLRVSAAYKGSIVRPQSALVPVNVTPSVALSGTAAAGLPLVGNVTVKDALGATKTVPIRDNGSYSVDVLGM